MPQRTPFGSTAWSVPLASYSGIAHHVRASLSGLRHELILVHPDPAKNLLVAVADRIPQATLDRAKALLRLPEVPAKSLYMRGGDVTTNWTEPVRMAGVACARLNGGRSTPHERIVDSVAWLSQTLDEEFWKLF